MNNKDSRNIATQTDAVGNLNHLSFAGGTISERGGSDFDLGSFRGSLLDHSDRRGRKRWQESYKASSHIAVEENPDPRDITFQRSDKASVEDKLANSPDIVERNLLFIPNTSPTVSQEEFILNNKIQSDSPVSINSRSKSKTVSFNLKNLKKEDKVRELEEYEEQDIEDASYDLKPNNSPSISMSPDTK